MEKDLRTQFIDYMTLNHYSPLGYFIQQSKPIQGLRL